MNIVYDLLGGVNFGNWVNGAGVGECVFAIIVMFFIKQAEPIVRKIFGFDNASSLGSALASGALLMSSMKTASNAINKAKEEKGSGTKAKNGKPARPQQSSNAARNTMATISQGNQNNTNSTTVSKNQQNSSGSNGSNNNTSNSTSQNLGQSSTTQNSQPGNRNLDTSRVKENLTDEEKKQRRNDIIKKFAGKYVDIGFRVAGTAIGGFASDDMVTGGITGYGYGTALGEGAKSLGGKAAGAGRKIANTATRRHRLNNQTNQLIDEYNKLKSLGKWNDNDMFNQSRAMLQIKDLNKINDPNMRNYAEVLHKYREIFEERDYKNPNDMVLDAIDKIQTGELEKTEESVKRYTRKK